MERVKVDFSLLNEPMETQIQLGLVGMFNMLCDKYGKEQGINLLDKYYNKVKQEHKKAYKEKR